MMGMLPYMKTRLEADLGTNNRFHTKITTNGWHAPAVPENAAGCPGGRPDKGAGMSEEGGLGHWATVNNWSTE
jgi:hypothetical protein